MWEDYCSEEDTLVVAAFIDIAIAIVIVIGTRTTFQGIRGCYCCGDCSGENELVWKAEISGAGCTNCYNTRFAVVLSYKIREPLSPHYYYSG